MNEQSNIEEKITPKKNPSYTTLVCSGGGTKGFSLIGSLEYLHENGYLQNINTFAGTSIGGVISTLIVIGYQPKEIFEVMSKINLFKMKNQNFHNVIKSYGIDDGQKIEILLTKLLSYKQIDINITLKEVYEKTNKTLILSTTCINDKTPKYMSHESYPDLKLITALRMTSAIPLYFTPVIYDNKYFIDGACMDNFPMHLFDKPDVLEHTLGIYLTTKVNQSNIENAEDFLSCTVQSMLEYPNHLNKKYYKNNIIDIILENNNYGFMDYDISDNIKKNMFDTGYDTTKNFFMCH